MSVNKNLTDKISESSFLNELEKQETAFRTFLASLKKCPNKDFVHSEVQKSKIKAVDQIKKTESTPSNNFRISFIKPQQKQKTFKREEINKSFIKASQRNLSQLKQPSKQSSQLTNRNRLLSQRYKENCKKGDKSLGNHFQSEYKTAQNLRSLGQSKLKIQQISSVTWNPDSHEFLTKLYQQQNQSNSQNASNFLLQLLNMNVSSMLNFFQQETSTIMNLNQIQGKDIYTLFKQIFDLQKFTTIKEPLIKKYNNCIFYGQKPNFDSLHSGIILYFNGNAYFGSLRNFQKHGLGIDFVHSENLSTKLYKSSFGNSQNSEYVIFRGSFYKNSKSGQFLIHAQYYIYQGFIVKGFFEGSGTLITPSSVFKGLWSLNKKVSGSQTFKNQPMAYEGEYKENKFHSKGKLKNSGQFYEGQFKNGLKEGKGILVNKELIYEGMFENGKKHGDGIIFDKSQYSQLNPEIQSKKFQFQACIYKVQFEDDELIRKDEFKNDKMTEQESLATLEQQKSVCEALTIDFDNIRPSKMLNSYEKDKVPEKRRPINMSQENKKYTQFLSVLPGEPQEQQLYSHKKSTYLLGNKFSRSPTKTRRQMD